MADDLYGISRWRHEIGVRLALGGQRASGWWALVSMASEVLAGVVGGAPGQTP
jgi:hypothetical protein